MRWILWFGGGIGLAFIFVEAAGVSKNPDGPLYWLSGLGFSLWFVVTFFAVPISLVRWLVKGRSSAANPTSR